MIPSKCLKVASSSLAHWVKCIYKSSGLFLVCYKKFLGVLKVVTNNIYFSNMIFPLTFMKVWVILIQKNKDCYWIKIEEIPEYRFFDNTEN